ncbi:hypothetical protein AB0D14_09305 [Streptomyces sp. NPDC048484]|uniref:SCO2400 family protein n=1 Tax=Streptomyces sp. NPDC048484 TaxID=3155146 RepID=UPI003438BF6C
MDYCSSCRRHLNGALVCPGCGAYAPDIAPVVVSRHAVQPRVTMAAGSAAADAAPVWEPARGGMGVGLVEAPDTAPAPYSAPNPGEDPYDGEGPYDGFEGAAPAPQGRAARRRQRARWKKNQRRAVVATAVALVGGGLTFTAMNQNSADRAEAASAPEAAGGRAGSVEEEPSQYTRPSSARPDDVQRSSDASSTQSPANGDGPGRRSAAAPTSLAPQGSRPAAVPSPNTTPSAASDLGSRNASSSSSSSSSETPTGTASQQPSVPATGGSDGSDESSDTGGTGSSDPGTSPASPAPTATSPSQLCLLVVCIG